MTAMVQTMMEHIAECCGYTERKLKEDKAISAERVFHSFMKLFLGKE